MFAELSPDKGEVAGSSPAGPIAKHFTAGIYKK
jgi:hypothetical protein